jgi:FkbM family methyltransferase
MVDWLANTLRPHPFRGKLRLLDPLAPRQGRRSASVFNFEMQLDLADTIQRHIYLGTYEPRETALVREWLKPGMTFVDAGANVGYFTALAASCVGPSGRVFAVEPQPKVYEQLAAMVQRNRLTQVRAFQCGLSAAEGELPLYLPPESDGEHHTTRNATMIAHGASRQIAVPVKTLDACIAEWGIERVDLLKIDVEGHEPQVFQGAARALVERRIRAILCEFNEFWLRRAGSSAQQLHALLAAAGFTDLAGSPHFPPAGMETRFLYLAGD